MEPNNSDEFILWLFRYRCIICNREAQVIHEIIPRSSGKEAMDWKNKVTLCNEHHTTGKDAVHKKGISDDVIRELQEKRIEFLKMIGRKEYG